MVLEASEEEEMGQPASAPPPDRSFGALLRAFRHRACLSQEQLAAQAELRERTVRNLEAGRVRSPRNETVRLLADALALTKPEQETWAAAAQGANGRQAEAGLPGADGPARLPRRVTVAVLTADAQDASSPAITWLIAGEGQTLLVVHWAIRGIARHPLARLTLPVAQRARRATLWPESVLRRQTRPRPAAELAILVDRQQVRPMVSAVFELSAPEPVRAQRARRDPGKVVISVASTAGR